MKELNNYYKACDNLAQKFLNSLYEDEDFYNDEAYWIGDNIGEVFAWGDWFVDMNQIADYFKYKYTPSEFFDFYEQWFDDEDNKVNMKNFKTMYKNIT